MRGSHCASSRVMRSWIERRVLTVFGSNRKRPRLPPNLGVRNLSGCSVIRITRIDSRTFVSPSDHATRPSGPTRGGKLIPRPNIWPAFIGFLNSSNGGGEPLFLTFFTTPKKKQEEGVASAVD